MKFIVVDDEEINLMVAKRLLMQVVKVEDINTFKKAEEALHFLQSYDANEPVSLFLDLNMPDISGWEFLDLFRRFTDDLKSQVRIYIVSSSIDPADINRATLDPNVIAYVSKPLTLSFIKRIF